MKTTVYLDVDTALVHIFTRSLHDSYLGDPVEVPEDKVKEWERIEREYDAMQAELHILWKEVNR